MFSRIERSERRVNFGLFRLRGIVLSVMSVVALVEVIRPLVTVSQIGSHPPHPQLSYKYLDFWYVDIYLYNCWRLTRAGTEFDSYAYVNDCHACLCSCTVKS